MQMQQQQAQVERQPFFKPLTSSIENNANFFSYDQPKQRTQEVPQRQANTSATFFAPLSQKQKEHEMSQNSTINEKTASDRLSDLHSKLHNEAEKIRKWKVQTEIEIKQKDRKLQESAMSIDSLRKTVLELQMNNESLGMKLKEELDNREEIVQKINATRDICNLLKEHTSKVEKKLQSCDKERVQLRTNEKENVKNLEDLSKRFTLLDIKSKEHHNNLINKLQLEQEDKAKMSADFEARLNEAEAMLNNLQQSYQIKEQEITVIRNEMKENQAHIQDMVTEQNVLGQKFSEASALASQQKEHIDKVTTELGEVKDSKTNLETELRNTEAKLQEAVTSKDKMAKNFEETEKLYIEKVKSLKETHARVEEELDQEMLQVEELEKKLKKAQAFIEELKSSKDMLILERTEAQDQKKALQSVCERLEKEFSELDEKYSSLCGEQAANEKERMDMNLKNGCLQATIDALNEQIITLSSQQDVLSNTIQAKADILQERESEIHQLKGELKDALHREKASYEKLDQLKEQLNTKSDEHLQLNQQIEDLRDEHAAVKKDFATLKKENTKLKKDIEKLAKKEDVLNEQLAEAKQQVVELKEEVERLENANKEKEENAVSLLEQGASTTKSLQDELSSKQKRTETLDAQVKNLKSEMTEKNKKIRDLEKELKTNKGKLTSSTKASSKLEDEIQALRDELEKAAEAREELQDKMKETESSLKENNGEVEKMRKETNELKKTTNKAVKDKEKASNEFEAQMGEMMATLQKYKQDNQKIVEQKDKELEQIKTRIENKSNKQHDDEIAVLRDQIEALKTSLKTTEEEKEKSANLHHEEKLTVVRLSSDLKEKEEELAKLSKLLENLQQETDILKEEKMEWSKTKEDEAVVIKETTRRPAHAEKPRVQEVPRTPVVKKTPTMGTMTPLYRTPQRSILRQPDSAVSKKRRVMFAGSEDDVSGSESSSSELMEVDIDEIETRLKIKTPQAKSSALPLHLRPSPKVRQSPVVAPSAKAPVVPMKPVPRGSSWQKKNKAEMAKTAAEKEANYPGDEQIDSFYKDDGLKKKKMTKASGNIRKTPNKGPGKFFKSSPHERRKIQALKENRKQENLSWFDSDNVFGFDMED